MFDARRYISEMLKAVMRNGLQSRRSRMVALLAKATTAKTNSNTGNQVHTGPVMTVAFPEELANGSRQLLKEALLMVCVGNFQTVRISDISPNIDSA